MFTQTTIGSTGSAGKISIETGQLSINDGAAIATTTFGQGNAGDIFVQAKDSISVDNGSILSGVAGGAIGNSGDIELQTRSLWVTGGGTVQTQTLGQGKAGDIRVTATDAVTLNGVNPTSNLPSGLRSGSGGSNTLLGTIGSNIGQGGDISVTTGNLSIADGGVLDAQTQTNSKGGDITVYANTLSVNNSLISASTQRGTAGSLTINASESVDLNERGGLSVEATQGGTAGTLSVETGQMSVSDGAAVTVSSPSGIAGNLNITANSLFLNRGTLSAETGKSSPQGGANITLKGLQFLRLENESLISASAFNAASGGNIDIDTTFLIALPPVGPNGSDIIANAQQGSGGKIDINAAGIFGIEERRAIPGNRTNDIDASSEFGAAGQVTLSTLINPSQGLSQLPTQLVDPTRQIDSSCAARGDNQSKFTVTGRGGLPSTPSDLLTPELVLDDFGTLATANPPASEPVKPASSSPHKQLVEAQGWIIGADGTVILTAQAPSVTPHTPALTPASCQHTQN